MRFHITACPLLYGLFLLPATSFASGFALQDVIKPTAKATAPRVDFLGDPLPTGAIARFGSLRGKHQGPVLYATFSPDGKWIASAGEAAAVVHLWDAVTGKEMWRFEGDKPSEMKVQRVGILAFSPDGSRLAAGLTTATGSHLLVLDAATGKRLWTCPDHKSPVVAVAFADKGKTLIAACANGTVIWSNAADGKPLRMWSIAEILPVKRPSPTGFVQAAVFAPDARQIAILAEGHSFLYSQLFVLDLKSQRINWGANASFCIGHFDSKVLPPSLTFSPDNKLLAFNVDGQISVRDAGFGKECYRIGDRSRGFAMAAFTHDSQQLAVLAIEFGGMFGGRNSVIYMDAMNRDAHLCDANSGKPLRKFSTIVETAVRKSSTILQPAVSIPQFFVFSPDAKKLLINGRHNELVLWDLASGKQVESHVAHHHSVHWLRFSPDSSRLESGSEGWWHKPETVISWDCATGKTVQHSVRAVDRKATDLAFFFRTNICSVTADHRFDIRFLEDNSVVLFDRNQQQTVRQLHPPFKFRVDVNAFFSPTGKLLIFRPGPEVQWSLQDTITGKEVCRFTCEALHLPTGSPVPLVFSPDEKQMAWCEKDGSFRVLDVASGKTLHKLANPGVRVFHDDFTIRNGEQHWGILAFSPGGGHLATWDSGTCMVRLWNLETRKILWSVSPKKFSDEMCFDPLCLAFSPDGRTLALGGLDRENDIRLFEVSSGRLRLTLTGHRAPVESLEFSPDGRKLASGSADTTVLLWDLAAVQ